MLNQEYTENFDDIIKSSLRFISAERDQMKDLTYEQLLELDEKLPEHNTILVGSGRYYDVVNPLASEKEMGLKYDFYHMKRGLDFAKSKGMNARYHTLLDKETLEKNHAGDSKEEVLANLREYVKHSIEFINEYNTNKQITNPDGTKSGVIKSVDLFNEIVAFDKPYENEWQKQYGITIKDIAGVFEYAKEHKPEGVTYVYNEPFLEDDERRQKVFEVLNEIQKETDGIIDTLGTQMHIESNIDINKIKRCFKDFKDLQGKTGIGIQITEFDMSTPESELFDENGKAVRIPNEIKTNKMIEVNEAIKESGVNLEGITYWTSNDTLSPDLERTNKKTYLLEDFKEKFRNLGNIENPTKMEELENHPYLKMVKLEKNFSEVIAEEHGYEQIEQYLEDNSRDIITTRKSGLYSNVEQTSRRSLQEIGRATSKEASENLEQVDATFERASKEFEKWKNIRDNEMEESINEDRKDNHYR